MNAPRHSSCTLRSGLATVLLAMLALPAVASLAQTQEESVRFDFGHGPRKPGFEKVDSDTLYDEVRGFGLEPGASAASLDRAVADTVDRDLLVAVNSPFLFSVRLPEGNHRVRVVLGDPAGEADCTVKAESRRLMLERITTTAGQLRTEEFTVNIRRATLVPPPANAPGLTRVQLNDREVGTYTWDDKLTLEFTGPRACVASVEISPAKDTRTVFLIGDSTVTDQGGEPAAGWGQMLPRFLTPEVAVANHAESGETLKSFLMEGRLAKVLEQVKAGDYLFIQFGHNDSKTQWPQTFADADSTYPAYLRAVVAEARLRGVIPVLVTSMHRRKFDKTGHVVDTHGGYPAAVRRVAAELYVPLIDLHALSAGFYEKLGVEGSAVAFTDATHHNNYGGYQLARLVAGEIQRQIPGLAAHLRPGLVREPWVPDEPATWTMAPSALRQKVAPRGN